MFISSRTKGEGNAAFFTGNKSSPWYVVAFGMIGASLSGITFISVPGWVATTKFAYMQMVLGYLIGYVVVAQVLLPLYYKLNLVSIYGYLEQRFGTLAYKTGATFFLISRTIGAAFRIYLVALVFNYSIFDRIGFDFGNGFWGTLRNVLIETTHIELEFIASVVFAVFLIWVYTRKGGIKTIVWTDTLQTLFMLLAVIITFVLISQAMELSLGEAISYVKDSDMSKVFFLNEPNEKTYFFKYLISGAFITIAMTGLDQDMMQKNLTCRNLKEAQKNMYTFSFTLIFVNLLFLALGVMLYGYMDNLSMPFPEKADLLFPTVALDGNLGIVVGLVFILGLVAAAYSSADSALTSLTTSVCVDFLDVDQKATKEQVRLREKVHWIVSLTLIAVILVFRAINDDSVIQSLFVFAGYTYGPLLGLFSFGLITRLQPRDTLIPVVTIIAPILTFILQFFSPQLFGGYQIGFELLPINGCLTFGLLWIVSQTEQNNNKAVDNSLIN